MARRRLRRARSLVSAPLLAAAGLALGVGLASPLGELRPPPKPGAEAPLPAPEAEAEPVRIRGGAALALSTRRALERLLDTRVGARARAILEARARSAPLTIELNLRGDHYTLYRVPGEELGETIVFDPRTLPRVETERGRLAATRETVLAHELGHAVFKLRAEDAVIREIENPVREELGLPRRVRF